MNPYRNVGMLSFSVRFLFEINQILRRISLRIGLLWRDKIIPDKLGRVMQGYMQHSAVSIFTTMTSLADWFNITSPSQIKTLSYSTIQLEWKKTIIDIAHWCTLRLHVVSTWTCSFEYTYHFWTIKPIKEDLWLQR